MRKALAKLNKLIYIIITDSLFLNLNDYDLIDFQ